jgi:hypothetical protein
VITRALKGSAIAFAILSVACSRTAEPEFEAESGTVVLRFEPPAAAMSAAASGGGETAAVFDSVIVRVFRPGTPIAMEKWQGAQVGVDPVEMTLSCVAESNKRISVELFYSGLLTYHGANVDVDVVAGVNTPVTVNASKFFVDALYVTPSVVADPAPFDLSWTSAPAAAWYRLQASRQPNFAVIEWDQNVTDTVATTQLPPGMHYVRVIPMTDYATGLRTGPEGGYVTGGSGTPLITGFSAPEVIPTETVTILGENLDAPGTQAWIGSTPAQEMTILSSSWGSLLVRVPRAASTDVVAITSPLPPGGALAPEVLVVQRVAYVTDGDEFSDEFREVLSRHWDDFGYSGVAVVPVADLDTRDMGVFDIVIVADDTGTDASDWGGGVPSRATAIAATGANVLAMGEGGLAFLRVVAAVGNAAEYQTNQTSYYTEVPNSTIYTTPHDVAGGAGAQWIDISQNAARTIAVEIRSPVPAGVALDACTGISCPLLLCSPNERWSLVEFQVPDVFSAKKTYVFWGFGGNPEFLTKQGEDLLGNAMHLLYNERSLPPADAAQR